jgi:hypothetical protein
MGLEIHLVHIETLLVQPFLLLPCRLACAQVALLLYYWRLSITYWALLYLRLTFIAADYSRYYSRY